jgi:hypothetical protein
MCLISQRSQELALVQEEVEELGGALTRGGLEGNTLQTKLWQVQLVEASESFLP